MRLFLIDKNTNMPYAIEIEDIDVLNKSPSIGLVSKETRALINYTFSKYGLTHIVSHGTKYHLHIEQVLALILSSSLPVEDSGATVYRNQSLSFPVIQVWWHFDFPQLDQNNNWQHLNCGIVNTYYNLAEKLFNNIKRHHDSLVVAYNIFLITCAQVLKLTKPYHPLLPTPQMLLEKKDTLLSDHLPQLFCIGDIKCLSWNIMHPTLACGYYPYTDSTEVEKNSSASNVNHLMRVNEQISYRKSTIQTCIITMVKKQAAQIITLQENFLDHQQLQQLCKDLGLFWQLIFNNDKPHLVILFNSSVFYSVNNTWDTSVQTATLSCSGNNITYVVHNVHLPHKEVPFEAEALTLKLLLRAPNDTVIVIGDFNSRIPPVKEDQKLIVSGVTSKLFRDGSQGCDWTDGCFVLHGDKTEPMQVDGEALNPATGEKFIDHSYTLDSYHHTTLSQRVELNRFRPFMDIIGRHLTVSTPVGTLVEIESQLCKVLDDPSLKVRLASNAFNQRGIAIVSNALDSFRKKYSQEIVTHVDESSNTSISFMCCSIETLMEFYEMAIKLKTRSIVYSYGSFFSSRETVLQSDSSITDNMMSLSCFGDFLPEKISEVSVNRQIKEQLIKMSNEKSSVKQICAQVVLSNYYLHFTEYHEFDHQNMSNPKGQLLRPTHFLFAMGGYLEICKLFATVNIHTFTPLQRQIIKANLITLGENITIIYNIFAGQLQEQVMLFEKRLPINQKRVIDQKIITDTTNEIENTYRLVLMCQTILNSKNTSLPTLTASSSAVHLLSPSSSVASTSSNGPAAILHPAEQPAEVKGAKSLSTINITIAPINLVKSFLHKVYPDVIKTVHKSTAPSQ